MTSLNALSRRSRQAALVSLLILVAFTLALAPAKTASDTGDQGKSEALASQQGDDTIRVPFSRSNTSWSNYAAPGDEGWTWDGQRKTWSIYGFTADDSPQELVKQNRLEISAR